MIWLVHAQKAFCVAGELTQEHADASWALVEEITAAPTDFTLDTDGPAGMCSPTLSMFGTGYCCNMIISQTWNREPAYKAAQGIAQEFYDFGVVGWYAPSMNTHRSAFAGRNFEYYSKCIHVESVSFKPCPFLS